MAVRLSGKEIRTFVGDLQGVFEKVSIKIDDKRAVAKSRGVPNGHVDGEVSCTVSVTVDAANFLMVFGGLAEQYGSYRGIPELDFKAFGMAGSGGLTQDIDAFGVLWSIEDLLDADSKGGEKLTSTIRGEVTSPDFVNINGVPYLTEKETDGLF